MHDSEQEWQLRSAAERLQRLLSVRPPHAHAALWRESIISAGRTLHATARPFVLFRRGGEQRIAAVRASFEALAVLAEFRDAAAATELPDLCDELRSDSDPTIVAEVRLQDVLREVDGTTGRAAGRACGELLGLLELSTLEWRHLFAARQATRRLGEASGASVVLLEFAQVLSRSPHAAVAAYSRRFEGTARRLTLVGKIPEILGTLAGGEPFSLEQVQGSAVFVEFWATWCGPCRRELPTLKAIYDRYRPRGFEIVGISIDDELDRLARFLAENEICWPVLFDYDARAGAEHPLAVKYGINGVPTGLLIDRSGRVAATGIRATELVSRLPRILEPG